MFKIILLTITLTLSFSISAFAKVPNALVERYTKAYHRLEEGETFTLTAKVLIAMTETEMTKQEQVKVKRFVSNYKKKNSKVSDGLKIYTAIRILSKQATYEKGLNKPSDLLKGKADCQGYSLMLHYMLNSVGVKNYLEVNKKHVWNVVEGEKTDMTVLYKIFRN